MSPVVTKKILEDYLSYLINMDLDRSSKADKEVLDAFDEALKLIEKEIPKKIKNIHGYNVCPRCGSWPVQHRCQECGQVCDWSED